MLRLGLLTVVCFAVAVGVASASKSARFVLRSDKNEDIRKILKKNCADARLLDTNELELYASESEEETFRGLGLHVVEKEVGRPLNLDPPAGYNSPAAIFSALQNLEAQYPSRAKIIDLTAKYGLPSTVLGNHIFVFKIAADLNQVETKPNVILVSNHHARELVTPEIALNISTRFVVEYSTNAVIRGIVDSYQVYVLYTLNPDGLNYVWTEDNLWRKNRRNNGDGTFGVDLNRNYPIGWDFSCAGSTDTSSEEYRGPSAASEVEVQTMLAFHEDIRPVKVLDLHSYAREVRVIYGDCANLPSLVDNYFISIAREVSDAIGYEQTRSCCMGGNIHAAYHNQGSLSFLIETATAFQPPAELMKQEIVRVTPGILDFFSLPTPISGRVIDARTGRPAEAFFYVSGLQFSLNEVKRSNPLNGNYHLWLPDGSYNVTVSIPNYIAQVFQLTALRSGVVRDIVI